MAASETTTSTSFTDLATVGPAVTVNIGANGLAWVSIYNGSFISGSGFATMGFAISGASTVAASDQFGAYHSSTASISAAWSGLVSGLTPGSNTFTCKYKNSATLSGFSGRRISVLPL